MIAGVTVVDAQGGGIGKSVVRLLKQRWPQLPVLAVGTNAMATAAMLKAGADVGATGENAVVFNCAQAQLLIAPLGMAMANAMYGEVSPRMAEAVAGCAAAKILIPVSQSQESIVGLADKPLAALLKDVLERASDYIDGTP